MVSSLATSLAAPWACLVMARTMSWNCALRATKSVSVLTSTMAPARSPAMTPISPSAATRPALLAALERPFLRSQSTASCMWPLVSVSAVLQSIMPAPVFSRSCVTRLADMVVMACASLADRDGDPSRRLSLGQLLGGGHPVVARDAAAQVEGPVEQLAVFCIKIRDLPEVEYAEVVEALLEL